MPKGTRGSARPRNRILAALPADEYQRLAAHLKEVSLTTKQVLFDADKPIEHVYFPERGVASIVGIMTDGSSVETATIGNEGMVGLSVFHGVDRTAAQAFCQVSGSALRMSAATFVEEARANGRTLSILLGRYTEALFIQVAQSSACNRVHPMRERCARWLLQTHDRVGEDEFPITHQFLAQMLGVRRATVTEAVGTLQKSGLIDYKMGTMSVLDRRGLERAACECYSIIKREFDRLLEGRESPSPLRKVRTSARGKTTVKEPQPRDEDDADI